MPIVSQLTNQCDNQDILREVDKKLSSWSKSLSDNIRYGFKNKINYISFESLSLLRDIFVYKQHCADWLEDICTEDIVDQIRKITRKTC